MAQPKHFYVQRFHARLGPLTSGAAHVRAPKAAPFPTGPVGGSYAPSFQPIYRESSSRLGQWEDDELSAATFRARALERIRDEPRNSFAPAKPNMDTRAKPTRSAAATYPTVTHPTATHPTAIPTASRAVGPSAPSAVVNAPLTSLEVLVGNSQLTTQPRQNLYRRAAYLLDEAGQPDIYADGSVTFSSAALVCATELVLEITGRLPNFAEYAGEARDSKFIAFYAGANPILGHITCWADYLMHGTLESYEFGADQLHLFRLPLGHEPGQGIHLRDKAKLRVALQRLDLTALREAGLRHRFIVRYYEEKL